MPDSTFAEKWQAKEVALIDYLAVLEYPNMDTGDADAVLKARLRYIDAAHDAMEIGLELLNRRAK